MKKVKFEIDVSSISDTSDSEPLFSLYSLPNITQSPIKGLINELMNSSKYFINILYVLVWSCK